MIRYALVGFLILFAIVAFAAEQTGIEINGNVVTMPLKAFNEIVLYVKQQSAKIGELQEEVDWHRGHEVKIENCVRDHIDNHQMVLACFGDKEI